MAKVHFSTYVRVAGCYEPYENVFSYLYCDHCGSFDLDTITHPYTTVQVILKAIVPIGFFAISGELFALMHNLCLTPFVGIFCILAFYMISKRQSYKCKKCGNENLSQWNVFHYSPDETSALDVPVESVVKEYNYSLIPRM